MTVASGVLTVAGEVDATSLDISGNADIDGTLEADAITIDGTAIGSLFATQGDATALAVALG
jgi:cytoskeletal protein CcmA (bactofilin family)